MGIDTWKQGWQLRLHDRIKIVGYDDVFTYVVANAGKTIPQMFGELRKKIGIKEGLSLVQFREMYYVDSLQHNQLKQAFAISLIRWMKALLRTGWNHGRDVERRRLQVKSNWEAPVDVGFGVSGVQWMKFQDEVWMSLINRLSGDSAFDDQWCPGDDHDPVIASLIDEHWPISS